MHPIGSIVVEGGSCYVQVMSSDVPSFPGGTAPTGQQMKAMLLSDYIAYTGPCTVDEAAGKVVLNVEAAWQPNYVGTERGELCREDCRGARSSAVSAHWARWRSPVVTSA
jgi:hypothetical protein